MKTQWMKQKIGGESWAIGLLGSQPELQFEYWGLLNWSQTDSAAHDLGYPESFLYVLTTREQFVHGLACRLDAVINPEPVNDINHPLCGKIAESLWDMIPTEPFLFPREVEKLTYNHSQSFDWE